MAAPPALLAAQAGKKGLKYGMGHAAADVRDLWEAVGAPEADWNHQEGRDMILHDPVKSVYPSLLDDDETEERAESAKFHVPDLKLMAKNVIKAACCLAESGIRHHLNGGLTNGLTIKIDRAHTSVDLPTLREVEPHEFVQQDEKCKYADKKVCSSVMNTLRNVASTKTTMCKTGDAWDLGQLEQLLIWASVRVVLVLLEHEAALSAAVRRYFDEPNEKKWRSLTQCANVRHRWTLHEEGRGMRTWILGWIRYAHGAKVLLDTDAHNALYGDLKRDLQSIVGFTEHLRGIKTPEVALEGCYVRPGGQAKRGVRTRGSDGEPFDPKLFIKELCGGHGRKVYRVHYYLIEVEDRGGDGADDGEEEEESADL